VRTEPLAAINSVALAIGRFETLDAMLDYALGKVLEVVQTDAGCVYLLDEDRGELLLAVSHGLSEEARRDFDRLKVGEGLAGRVVAEGTPIVIRSLKDDPRLTRMVARSEGFRAFASIPLRWSFKTYGTLNVHSRADLEFTEEDVQLLTSMAGQIGLAVANARLYLDLQASERKFRGLVENAEDLIYLTDRAGRLTYANPAASTLLGYDPESLCEEQRTVLSLVHPDDRQALAAALDRMLGGEILHALEFRMAHAGGESYRWFSQTNVPLRDEDGRVVGIQAVAHDITERRAMRAKIAQAERFADLGRMAAGIAHEIRNPLNAIANSVNVLRRGSPADPRLMQIVREEVDRLDAIVREFLAFARPPSWAPIPLDLSALIDDTVVLFRRDLGLPNGVDVVVRHADVLPLVTADPRQIRQVLWNLLKNAGESMSQPGRINVETSMTMDGGSATVSVTDDGDGIADATAVFEPFYTTRAQGTGLGLAVVARIIREHHGAISAANEPGRGAKFTFHLPVVQAEAVVHGSAAR
jgi:two-component system, sporulation sensor kinase E